MTNPHGGKRTHAGRKALPPEMRRRGKTVTLPDDMHEYLARFLNASIVVEAAIRRTKQFREWEQTRGD